MNVPKPSSSNNGAHFNNECRPDIASPCATLVTTNQPHWDSEDYFGEDDFGEDDKVDISVLRDEDPLAELIKQRSTLQQRMPTRHHFSLCDARSANRPHWDSEGYFGEDDKVDISVLRDEDPQAEFIKQRRTLQQRDVDPRSLLPVRRWFCESTSLGQ